ncbi:MAG: AsmA family protein [Gammaproteobacteria bacterium]|nr:AsmA family protein [Gammaproteobacteria bacterium]
MFNAQLYDGKVKGGFRYDVSDGTPDVGLTFNAENVDIGALLVAASVNERLKGSAYLKSSLRGRGKSVDELMSSLGGELTTQFLDGAIEGIDIQASLLKVKSALNVVNNESQNQNQPLAETRFAELSAKFQVDGGIFRTEDLSMKAPVFRLAGTGDIALPTQQIDLSLDVSVVDSLEGQGGKELEQLKGINIPLVIDGPLDNPSYRLDLVGLAQRGLRKEIEEVLKKGKGEDRSDGGISDSLGEGGAAVLEQLSEDPTKAVEDALKQELKKKLKSKLLQSLGG